MMRFSGLLLAALAAVAPASAGEHQAGAIEAAARAAMAKYQLKAIIVRVTSNDRDLYTGAIGDSMTGVPVTAQMHFRNGAMAFTYMSFLLMEFVDRKMVRLDAKLSKFFPDLPYADRITLKNLANMTSGYADYVYQPEVLHGVNLNPFRHWSSDELIRIGVSKPMMFAPGTNWGYSHTNYVILGRVLEKIAGMPLARAMQQYVFDPMRLAQTRAFDTPQIPTPVLHTYSSERRSDLRIPAKVPFYEESTFWDPSWTTATGAIEVTDITDMTRSMEIVGAGTLLTKASYAAEVGPNLAGFGHSDPKCPACHRNDAAFNYGLGVVNLGPWITQTKNFAGCGATVGYLPSKKLAISVVTTYAPGAFDPEGNYKNASEAIFASLADLLARGTLPVRPKS
jgi:CubicO group peptidase (beta-lactamase class C family)